MPLCALLRPVIADDTETRVLALPNLVNRTEELDAEVRMGSRYSGVSLGWVLGHAEAIGWRSRQGVLNSTRSYKPVRFGREVGVMRVLRGDADRGKPRTASTSNDVSRPVRVKSPCFPCRPTGHGCTTAVKLIRRRKERR